MGDQLAFRKKFGVLAPSTNSIVEPDFNRMGVPGVTPLFSRIHIYDADLSSEAQMEKLLLLPGAKKGDYITTPLSAADAEAWFGKAPPDLSLITRSKGSDYVYQFMKTFYADPSKPTGVDNLALPGTAMPHVLSALQGVQEAKFKVVEKTVDGSKVTEKIWESFETGEPGQLSAEEYDAFLRDTVNFLEYAGEPYKAKRLSLGVWVILFLLVFTLFAYLLKQEYWKDIK